MSDSELMFAIQALLSETFVFSLKNGEKYC